MLTQKDDFLQIVIIMNYINVFLFLPVVASVPLF